MSRRLVEALAVLLLLSALAWQLALALGSDGLTNDELLYIPAGYRQLVAGDYRLNPVHPPLALSLNALGLLGLDLRMPLLGDQEAILPWCFRFIHLENAPNVVIRRARLPVMAMTLALAALVWLWGRSVAGPLAGLSALFAVAFHPSIVAHGHLATTDLAGAFAGLLASWSFWRWLDRPGLSRAAQLAVAVALGAATRHTTLVLLPIFAAALAWALLVRRRRSTGGAGLEAAGVNLKDLPTLAGCALVLVPLTIWAAYGFHEAPWPPGLMRTPRVPAGVERWLSAAEATHVVPAGFVGSLRFQLEHARQGHPGYLLGERRMQGWWQYPFVAFAVKNTPGFLAAVLLSPWVAFRVLRATRGNGRDAIPAAASSVPWGLWLGCAIVVFASASLARIQIGERYLLPLYPFLCLLLGALASFVALVVLAVFHAGPTLGAVRGGGSIPYFNLLAGGREGGHRVLLDSNLDWGQDLPRLAAWMRRERVGAVQLAYHGADDPARYGIVWEDLPSVHAHPTRPAARLFQGVVVVSPNHLLGLPPRIGDTYAALRARRPDARAGVFFVYRLP
jgi:hypothetical protein